MSNWTYVGAAYGLTWLVLVGYKLYLRRRIRGIETRLARADGSAAGAPAEGGAP